MPSFLTPYLPFAYLLLALGLFGGGVKVGYDWEAGVHARDQITIANAYLETGNRQGKAESAAALAVAETNAARRVADNTRRSNLELELAKDENARTCHISDGTFRVLNDAIDASNDVTPKAGSIDGAQPAVPEAGQQVSSGLVESTAGWVRGLRGLPKRQASLGGVDQSR